MESRFQMNPRRANWAGARKNCTLQLRYISRRKERRMRISAAAADVFTPSQPVFDKFIPQKGLPHAPPTFDSKYPGLLLKQKLFQTLPDVCAGFQPRYV